MLVRAKSPADTETRICSRDLQVCKTRQHGLLELCTRYTSDVDSETEIDIKIRELELISYPSLGSAANVSGAVTLQEIYTAGNL